MGRSHVNVVIDVIRAFTVAHYAFLRGANGIYMVGSTEEAFDMKRSNPDLLLAGEVQGLPIDGFDLDNSPTRIRQLWLGGRYLVQKTTNGVKATLNSLNAEHVLVTGFSNAKATTEYIKRTYTESSQELLIHLIASHPTGDDDLACAEYISHLLQNSANPVTATEAAERILKSEAAKKFLDEHRPEFVKEDIDYCIRELPQEFVMKVHSSGTIPMIERVTVC